MPTLDSCISDLFEPGTVPSDPGTPPVQPHYSGYLLAETPLLEGDISSVGSLGFFTATSNLLLTITGTWVGVIQVQFALFPVVQFSSNVSQQLIVPSGAIGATSQVAMSAYTSGTAHVVLKATDRIIIETQTPPPLANLTQYLVPPLFWAVGLLKLD